MFVLLPQVEIEVRLGTNGKTFDSNINKDYFLKILHDLEAYNHWESVEIVNTVDYIHKNKKLTVHSDQTETLILKENVKKNELNVNNIPFDIRFSVNQEWNINSQIQTFNKSGALVRKKSRKSFYGPFFRYDLTYVVETNNSINKEKYEIEVELRIDQIVTKDHLSTWTNDYINDFFKCKILDLVKLVEKECINDSLINDLNKLKLL
jgi:hypothetical protein